MLYEVITSIFNQAVTLDDSPAFSLDPAGRVVVQLPTTDDSGEPQTYLKTIDSPLENLALYQRLMQTGCLPPTDDMPDDEVCSDMSKCLLDETKSLLTASLMEHLICTPEVPIPEEVDKAKDFLRAASFMAGAGDKNGRIDVDILIYLNNP